MLIVSRTLRIPDTELSERFVRSSGPGGQNVNKVSTAVELRFDARRSPSLNDEVRARLLAKRDHRITEDGIVIIQAMRYRTQDRNRQDARDRLMALLQTVLVAPKKRVATKPSKGVKERRLSSKRERAETKRHRASQAWERD